MNEAQIKSINFADLPIDRKEIDISLNYGNGGYKHINGRIEGANVICMENIILSPKSIIMNCFKESSSFIVLVATVGEEVDNWIERKKQNNDIIESFVADASD